MTFPTNTNRIGLTRLLAWNFALVLLLSAGTSHADNTEKKIGTSSKDHYKQIQAAVLAGKITKVEAEAKLKALKKQGNSQDNRSKVSANQIDEKTIAHLESIWTELQALVAAGKMPNDEANEVMSTIKRTVLAEKNEKKAADANLSKGLYKQIKAAIVAGKITKEEAEIKLKALQQQDLPKKRMNESGTEEASKAEQGKSAKEVQIEKAWAKLQEAVAAGKLTKDQAIAKMAAIKQAKLEKE